MINLTALLYLLDTSIFLLKHQKITSNDIEMKGINVRKRRDIEDKIERRRGKIVEKDRSIHHRWKEVHNNTGR